MRPAAVLLWIGLLALPAAGARGDTLLVVRESSATVEFMDPGSGLRLASVRVGEAPREITVSEDGLRAAVINHGPPGSAQSSLSIIDLRQPQEIRRVPLPERARPTGVAWTAPDRVVVATDDAHAWLLVDPAAGRVLGEVEPARQTPGAAGAPRISASSTAATPVMPRAVCHACTRP